MIIDKETHGMRSTWLEYFERCKWTRNNSKICEFWTLLHNNFFRYIERTNWQLLLFKLTLLLFQ